MFGQITISDYSSDWALDARNVDRVTPGYLTREQVIEFYGTLGIAGIEVCHAYWHDCEAARVKQLAADAGLPIVAYVAQVDLAVPASGRAEALDEISRLLHRTAALGAARIFLIPATYKEEFTVPEQRAWLIENLRLAAERAASMGIELISENIDYPPTRVFMGRGTDCAEICAEVGSPAFGLIYDVAAHLFVDEDPQITLNSMFPSARHVHLKNYRPLDAAEQPERFRAAESGKCYTGTTLDGGVLNIEAMVQELQRRHYQGFLQIEYQGMDDPRVALKHNVAYLQGILTRLAPA